MKVTYQGEERHVLPGAVRYPDGPPPLGTVLGPNGYSEYVTVVAHDGDRALCSRASTEDIRALREPDRIPGSVTEIQLISQFGGKA